MEYNANKFKEQGNQAYKSGDYRTALSYYNKAIQINPRDPAFYLNRSLCYYNMKHYEQCIKECDKSLQLNPVYIKSLKKKSAALVQLLKFEEALKVLKQAYVVEKTQSTSNQIQELQHFISNYNKYVDALKNEDYAEALSCVSYLSGKICQNKELKLVKIECLAKTGATDDALKELKSLQHEKNSETMYLKGLIELYSGDSAKAKSYFSQGMRIDSKNKKCHNALQKAKKCQKFKEQGNELIKANKLQDAEKKYTEALNLDPYNKKLNSVIYSNRALTYMKRKMWTKAAQDLNRSIELNPNYLKSYVKRAQVNMQRGQYSAAIHDYAKIQELDPKIDLKAKINQAKKKEKQAKKKDYYAILGISKNATNEEIKKAYKKMALKYHPDRNRNKSQVQQDEASKIFRDINEAQDILTDPEKRKLYDSGSMHADSQMGGDFSDFQHNMGSFSNMEGFSTGGMGGNGKTFTFKMNGQQMNGIDPNQIFSMFMGGSSFGGFANKSSNSQQKNKFSDFNGFNDFDFEGF